METSTAVAMMLALLVHAPAALLSVAAVPPPSSVRFSWDTVQPFFHADNVTGPYSDDAIRSMARFPLVTLVSRCHHH